MRDPNRIEPMLALIREIWYETPDLRLTQIIMNALKMTSDPYYIEDEKLKKALEEYKTKITDQRTKRGGQIFIQCLGSNSRRYYLFQIYLG